MTAPLGSTAARRAAVFVAAARALAADGAGGVDTVVASLRDFLRCDEVVLRGPAAPGVLARAVRHRAPRERPRRVVDVPVRVADRLHGVLTVVSDRPLTAEQAKMLTAVADVLALALAATSPDPLGAVSRAILEGEADRAEMAADVLERVGQALVAVRYAADLVALGEASAVDLDDPIRAALVALRETHRDLRAHALDAGLRAALHGLEVRATGDRQDDGRPLLRLTVHAEDPLLDEVPPAAAVTLQRVTEAVLRDAAGHARVTAEVDGSAVKLRVECADNAYDAGELVRWARRVSALGGALQHRADGVDVILPAQPLAEGHHDDRPHL